MQFIDLKKQQERIRDEIDAAIAGVLDHGAYIMGPEMRELESQLADYVGVKHCISCSSGTDALLMPLMAYDVGPGDAVFTSPFTFFATPESIVLTGATPVFVDIDPSTYNMDTDKLRVAIDTVKRNGGLRLRGIMPVDLFGLTADYDEIMQIAAEEGLFVIEDAAQSFGAEYKGRRAPSLGHVGATSFFPAKPLGCYGDGGAVFTDDDELAEKMLSVRVHGQGGDKYNNVRIGLNARMDTIQAAILLQKFRIYPEEIQMRQRVARAYTDRLNGLGDDSPVSRIPSIPSNCLSVFAQFCVESSHREKIQAKLQAAAIPSPIYYGKPMHELDALQGLAYPDGNGFPVSEEASRKIFALPFHPYLPDEDIDTIVSVIGSYDD